MRVGFAPLHLIEQRQLTYRAELKVNLPRVIDATESTPGREAEVGHLRSIVGLVWRSVVLWMVLLALLTLARLLG